MQTKELDFFYPAELIATERAAATRVMLARGAGEAGALPQELTLDELLNEFAAGDLLVLNDTRVLKRRVFSLSGLEILFLQSDASETEWRVLCPSSRWREGERQVLPGGIELEITARGKPQTVRATKPLTAVYFLANGEIPLPPYIQKARGDRHNRINDQTDYQTQWAEKPGSLAAPTASLHFTEEHLATLRRRGVQVEKLTLHVGLGTFLPVTVENLDGHAMHFEVCEVPAQVWQAVQNTKSRRQRVWALGTTVARALESVAAGLLPASASNSNAFLGETNLFIKPGFDYKVIDALLTNFHQPQSTLLALVAAFAGLEKTKACYNWAIEKKFRLFSYGDLTAWIK